MFNNQYLMESPLENKRLADKVNPKEFIHHYLSEIITPFAKILDVGCGPATISIELSRVFPTTKVTGLDISINRLLEINQKQSAQNLMLVSGNLYSLPFPDNTYDLVYSRLLFEYLKYPLKALKEMKRICKIGGTVLVQDINGQFLLHYPENIKLMSQINTIFEALNKDTGFDPNIGRKLYHLFYQSGFHDIQVQLDPYHLIAGKINSTLYQYWKQKLSTVLPHLRKCINHNEIDIKEVITSFLDYLKKNETLTFSNLFTVYGIK
ncbi:type 11 methyltransferase [Candidatus Magnetomorum sp. HK-1]|nr:type 11 methyltransferase [Candidatus Magnetomorum sp. HK-1]